MRENDLQDALKEYYHAWFYVCCVMQHWQRIWGDGLPPSHQDQVQKREGVLHQLHDPGIEYLVEDEDWLLK